MLRRTSFLLLLTTTLLNAGCGSDAPTPGNEAEAKNSASQPEYEQHDTSVVRPELEAALRVIDLHQSEWLSKKGRYASNFAELSAETKIILPSRVRVNIVTHHPSMEYLAAAASPHAKSLVCWRSVGYDPETKFPHDGLTYCGPEIKQVKLPHVEMMKSAVLEVAHLQNQYAAKVKKYAMNWKEMERLVTPTVSHPSLAVTWQMAGPEGTEGIFITATYKGASETCIMSHGPRIEPRPTRLGQVVCGDALSIPRKEVFGSRP